MPPGKAKRSGTKNASAATSAPSSKTTTEGTPKKSTKREKQPSQGKSGTDDANITTRPRGGKSAAGTDRETKPHDGTSTEPDEADIWTRPRGG